MQVTNLLLQILSRIAAVFLVALPLAALRLAVDDYESQVIEQMDRQQLIAFVKEVHASSYLSAYFCAAHGAAARRRRGRGGLRDPPDRQPLHCPESGSRPEGRLVIGWGEFGGRL